MAQIPACNAKAIREKWIPSMVLSTVHLQGWHTMIQVNILVQYSFVFQVDLYFIYEVILLDHHL